VLAGHFLKPKGIEAISFLKREMHELLGKASSAMQDIQRWVIFA